MILFVLTPHCVSPCYLTTSPSGETPMVHSHFTPGPPNFSWVHTWGSGTMRSGVYFSDRVLICFYLFIFLLCAHFSTILADNVFFPFYFLIENHGGPPPFQRDRPELLQPHLQPPGRQCAGPTVPGKFHGPGGRHHFFWCRGSTEQLFFSRSISARTLECE